MWHWNVEDSALTVCRSKVSNLQLLRNNAQEISKCWDSAMLSTRGPYVCTREQALPSRLLSSGCSSKQWTAIRADDTHDCTGTSLWNQRGKIADPFRCDCRVEGWEARGSRLHWPHKRRLLQSVRRERKKQQTASWQNSAEGHLPLNCLLCSFQRQNGKKIGLENQTAAAGR